LAQDEADAAMFHSTFGPGGPASPREVSHRDLLLPGGMISEVEHYYEAFGYAPAVDEPPDHVAVEAGFIGYLRLKLAYAVSQGSGQQQAVAQEAAEQFIREHLAAIAEPLEQALAQSAIRYLALAAEALVARTGPAPVRPASASALPVLDENDTDCGDA
jgi:nitrate reductase assembly molybdenum cofactor insertion protein NarJ